MAELTAVFDPIYDDVVYVDEEGRMVGFLPEDQAELYAEGVVYDPFGAVGWSDAWDLQVRQDEHDDDEAARFLEAAGLGEDDTH